MNDNRIMIDNDKEKNDSSLELQQLKNVVCIEYYIVFFCIRYLLIFILAFLI